MSDSTNQRLDCTFCGRRFAVSDSPQGCGGCTLMGSCGKVPCPYCGFENQRPLEDSMNFLSRFKKAWSDGTRQ